MSRYYKRTSNCVDLTISQVLLWSANLFNSQFVLFIYIKGNIDCIAKLARNSGGIVRSTTQFQYRHVNSLNKTQVI
jgi:hypothetical protein